MPTKIKFAISVLVLAVGAGVWVFERGLGNVTASWVAGGLAVFMVLAIWLFPEVSKKD
ncbi:MAG: hypothetical protein VX025_00040 [Pseudomonadota bacterium]|nr:hypothetical protein [Pseudomonadota bacterium]MEE3048395.1 hypothetical protein [Pseudomonadota bacterium]